MKAEIITTGTEILLGEITDANTAFLARGLALLGIDVHFTSSVGDNHDRFTGVLRQAWQRSDVIITTGGLGPTQGDITRGVIASFVGEEARVDETLKKDLMAHFARLGAEMPENNLKQATLIPSAVALPNPLGTAPGWWVEKDGRIIIALPGPPAELQPMWRREVAPRLQERSGAIIVSRILKTRGLSEGRVDELVSPFLSAANPTLAIYARQDGIVLRITAKAADEDTARNMISVTETAVGSVLRNHIWGTDEETAADVAVRLLAERRLTLAVCESITSGLLACTLAGVAGSSPWFRGGILLNGDEAKASLGLDADLRARGAGHVAAAMAAVVRFELRTDIGLAIEEETAPAGSQAGDGTLSRVFIATDTGREGVDLLRDFSWRRQQIARRAAQQALFTLHDLLLGWPSTP